MGAVRKGTKTKAGVPASFHQPHSADASRCGACGKPWPCPVAVSSESPKAGT